MTTVQTEITQITRWFHALSDETRVEILRILVGGERCVCDLTEALAAAQSRLSFHLKVLKVAGLVSDRREGRWTYYSLNPETLGAMAGVLEELKPAAGGVERGQRCCE